MLTGTGLRFAKGHGTENDFVLLPDPDGELELMPELVAALCDRRSGVGGDGVLRVVLTGAVTEVAHLADEARWFMDYRNADGGRAEMCGNGIRVYARYLVDAGYARPGTIPLATRAGVRCVELAATGDVTVEMGTAVVSPAPVTVRHHAREYAARAVSLGNPHAVVLLDEPVEAVDLRSPPEAVGTAFPDGVNVEFVREAAPGRLEARVHERGVGETRSCGTGACAAALAVAARRRRPAGGYVVHFPGGQLQVRLDGDRVQLRGPAVLVADGVLRPEWLAAHPGRDIDRPPLPEHAEAGRAASP